MFHLGFISLVRNTYKMRNRFKSVSFIPSFLIVGHEKEKREGKYFYFRYQTINKINNTIEKVKLLA